MEVEMKKKRINVLAAAALAVLMAAPAAQAKPFFRGAIAKGISHAAKEIVKHPEVAFAAAAVAICAGGCSVVVAPIAAP
jgi:hypothetical protein